MLLTVSPDTGGASAKPNPGIVSSAKWQWERVDGDEEGPEEGNASDDEEPPQKFPKLLPIGVVLALVGAPLLSSLL